MPAVPLIGGGRSRPAGARPSSWSWLLADCRQPGGIRTAEASDVVPTGIDVEARVLIERPDGVEQAARGVEAVGEVDAHVAGVRAGPGDVGERARMCVDRRVEQTDTATGVLVGECRH